MERGEVKLGRRKEGDEATHEGRGGSACHTASGTSRSFPEVDELYEGLTLEA